MSRAVEVGNDERTREEGNVMEWQLSQLGTKVCILVCVPLSSIILTATVCGITGGFNNLKGWLIFSAVASIVIIPLEILFYKLGQRVEAWDYPRIVKIENNRLRILWHDVDEKKYVDKIKPINFDSIYQIIIKDNFFGMYYVIDGKKYLTGFALDGFFIRYVTKEVEKRRQILNEVLKRIDKNKVKIVDKRRRKKFKIEGGDS